MPINKLLLTSFISAAVILPSLSMEKGQEEAASNLSRITNPLKKHRTDSATLWVDLPSEIKALVMSFYDRKTSKVLSLLDRNTYNIFNNSTQYIKFSKKCDNPLPFAKRFTHLDQLDLSWCNNITDTGISHLSTLINLKKLNLRQCSNITDTGISHLSTLINLNQLDLVGCNRITDTGISHLSNLTNLNQLDLLGCYRITDIGISHLSTMIKLNQLSLQGCDNITDKGISHLSTLINLKELNLWGCRNITDRGISRLSILNNLKVEK